MSFKIKNCFVVIESISSYYDVMSLWVYEPMHLKENRAAVKQTFGFLNL